MKIINAVTAITTLIGIFIVIGAVGYDDGLTMVGVVYPFSETVRTIFIGVSLIFISRVVRNYGKTIA